MADATTSLIPVSPIADMVAASGADDLFDLIRPEWKAKALIGRVKRLLPVDPSSACQRLLNAAIHDLREKIIIAGLDVAEEAAKLHKLPSVTKPEDVFGYTTTNTLDLAYQMGLIDRPDWRRLKRAYDIRKDLEHEDDQYEAGVADCVYVFSACIEIVLARDPISPVRVVDIKDIVEEPARIKVSAELLGDYRNAPVTRQVEIGKFLISVAGDPDKPDVMRQNCMEALRAFRPASKKSAQAAVGQHVQGKLKQQAITLVDMKIAAAAGIVPYLKQAKVRAFFEEYHRTMQKIGHHWSSNHQHVKLLDDFEDVGGFDACPDGLRGPIILWMTRCYIGEPGGYGMGANRPVFYSNSAAPRIEKMFKSAPDISAEFDAACSDKVVTAAVKDKHIARRLERLEDFLGEEET